MIRTFADWGTECFWSGLRRRKLFRGTPSASGSGAANRISWTNPQVAIQISESVNYGAWA